LKDHALALIRNQPDPSRSLNLLREYLQAFVLRSLHESEAFTSLAFVGGTALRFLHGLPRFSEDLDFSLIAPMTYEPVRWLGKVKKDLSLAGFVPEVTWSDRKAVHIGWIRLSGLLAEAGLAHRREQKLAIKLEVDARPPEGAGFQQRILTRHLTFFVRAHDLPSLFAGKLHALLSRPYAKGRDWYDLLWYLSQVPPVVPNLALLQQALGQSHPQPVPPAGRWRDLLRRRLAGMAPDELRRDVLPFLEHAPDASFLTRKHLEGAIRSHPS